MKKFFRAFFLLPAITAIFANSAFAQSALQNPTIRMQATAYIGEKNNENNSRLASVNERAATFELERKALNLINAERATKNLEALRWNDDVARIARLHSENMAKFKFFNHVGQDGLTVDDRADAIGLNKWSAIGENIAYNRGFENPVEFACAGWMKSTSHRENLLSNRWKETGIGVAVAADGTYYFTQVFLVR